MTPSAREEKMKLTKEVFYRTFPKMDKNKQYFSSYAEFNQFMISVDESLKDTPIVGRELKGMGEVAKRLQTNIHGVPKEFAQDNDFSILSLSAHVSIWFNKQYGKRLRVNLSNMQTICFISKDLYRVKIPLVFSEPKFVFTGNQETIKECINIGSLIENITIDKLSRITQDEIQYLAERVSYGCLLGNKFFSAGSEKYKDALADFKMSVDMLFLDKPLYGQSMWHCLQYVEKIIKKYLESKNISYKKTHELLELINLVKDIDIDESDLKQIQCSPSSRYDSDLHNEQDCVRSHETAQKISLKFIDKMSKKIS